MPQRHRLPWWVALAALLLTLGACAPEAIDPLALPTPFSFEVDNPEEIEGPVYGAMIVPFEGELPFGMGVSPKMAPPPNLDAVLNAILDGELDADGLVSGSFIPVVDVPRLNELLGLEFGWWVFLPPPGCDITATNPVEAAIAPIFGIAVWDGEAVDEGGYPEVAGIIALSESTYEEDDDTTTQTYRSYLPVASRAAWSATTNGACEPDDGWISSIEVDLQIAAGWQFVHVVDVDVCDKTTWSCSRSYTARSMTLEEIAAAGPIGTVGSMIMTGSQAARPSEAALEPIFR